MELNEHFTETNLKGNYCILKTVKLEFLYYVLCLLMLTECIVSVDKKIRNNYYQTIVVNLIIIKNIIFVIEN